MMIRYVEDENENSQLSNQINESLKAEVGESGRKPFAVGCVDETKAVRGGIRGVSHWGWLYISHLWVDARLRGRGVGCELIARAEAIAKARNCIGLYVDTFDEKARNFYRARGFQDGGCIPNFPAGSGARYYLFKPIK